MTEKRIDMPTWLFLAFIVLALSGWLMSAIQSATHVSNNKHREVLLAKDKKFQELGNQHMETVLDLSQCQRELEMSQMVIDSREVHEQNLDDAIQNVTDMKKKHAELLEEMEFNCRKLKQVLRRRALGDGTYKYECVYPLAVSYQ